MKYKDISFWCISLGIIVVMIVHHVLSRSVLIEGIQDGEGVDGACPALTECPYNVWRDKKDEKCYCGKTGYGSSTNPYQSIQESTIPIIRKEYKNQYKCVREDDIGLSKIWNITTCGTSGRLPPEYCNAGAGLGKPGDQQGSRPGYGLSRYPETPVIEDIEYEKGIHTLTFPDEGVYSIEVAGGEGGTQSTVGGGPGCTGISGDAGQLAEAKERY